jgi:hypothetical protein
VKPVIPSAEEREESRADEREPSPRSGFLAVFAARNDN